MAWNQVTPEGGWLSPYWQDENGNTSTTDPTNAKPQVNQGLAQLVASRGGSPLDPNTDLASLWNSTMGSHVNEKGQVLYNGGDSANQYWVNQGDPAFIAPPHHNDGFFQKDAYDPRVLLSEMPGLTIPLVALTAGAGSALLGGGAAAGEGAAGGAALAGGGEVGSGYAASAGALGAGEGAAGGAAFAGGGEAGSLAGSGANDTLGGSTMFDDYGNPLDMGSADAPVSSGNNFDPGYTYDSAGNYATADGVTAPSTSTDYGGMLQKAAAQFGITPASALKYLAGLVTKGAPAALGAYAANKQANSLQELADKYMNLGAPSRDRYEASFAPGFTMANDPGYTDALNQASKASMHALSVNGNPVGSPNAWGRSLQDLYEKTAYPALQTFRNQNASTGGIASFSAAAPGAATGAIGAQGNVFNAIGGGINDIFNPKPSLAQTLAEYKRLMATGG